MPGGNRSQLGNEMFAQALYLPNVPFPTIAASASATSTYTLPGALPGDVLSWNLQGPPAHIFLENAYVSAPNTLQLSWTTDATGVSAATVNVLFEVTRPENESLGLAALPSTVQ